MYKKFLEFLKIYNYRWIIIVNSQLVENRLRRFIYSFDLQTLKLSKSRFSSFFRPAVIFADNDSKPDSKGIDTRTQWPINVTVAPVKRIISRVLWNQIGELAATGEHRMNECKNITNLGTRFSMKAPFAVDTGLPTSPTPTRRNRLREGKWRGRKRKRERERVCVRVAGERRMANYRGGNN